TKFGSGSAGRRRRKSCQCPHPRLLSRLDKRLYFSFWRCRDARRLGSGQARPEESAPAPCLGTRRCSSCPSRDARFRRRERGCFGSPLWFPVWRCVRTHLRFRCTLSTGASCPVGLRQCGIRRAYFLLAACLTLNRLGLGYLYWLPKNLGGDSNNSAKWPRLWDDARGKLR